MTNTLSEKSQAANVILVVFLGPLGLFYASPVAATFVLASVLILVLLMSVYIVEAVTSARIHIFDLYMYVFIVSIGLWLGCLIHGCKAVNKHNEKIAAYREAREQERHREQLEAIEKTVSNQQSKRTIRNHVLKILTTNAENLPMTSREELHKAVDGLTVVIQAAALTLSSSASLSLLSTPERARAQWESQLRKLLDEHPPNLMPDENRLLEVIQIAFDRSEDLRGAS